MDIEAASRTLRVLTAAFPTYPVGEDTAEVYLGALMRHVRHGPDGINAAERWALEQTKFPKPVELLEACREEARRRVAAEAPPAIMDGSEVELSTEENARRVQELRANMATLFKRPA